MTDASVNIRAIQHYMYCPRRFALLEINEDWAENAFVVKADLMHERVHSGEHSFNSSSVVSRSSVALYNDEEAYDIFGVADCVEFVESSGGVGISGLDGKYKVRIIEYKPKPPKEGEYHESDAIQVFAQKICADYIWKCSCEAYVYYSETRKRVKLPFDERYDDYNNELLRLLAEMRAVLSSARIPDRRKGQKCSGCSLEDYCFSKKCNYSVRDEISKITAEEDLPPKGEEK